MNIEQIKETPIGKRVALALTPQRAEEVLTAVKIAGDAMNWMDSFGDIDLTSRRLSGAFDFEDTPQGVEFWGLVNAEVENAL